MKRAPDNFDDDEDEDDVGDIEEGGKKDMRAQYNTYTQQDH